MRVKVVFSKQDQNIIAWAWQMGEEYAVEMDAQQLEALAGWLEAKTARIYEASGIEIPPESNAARLAARWRAMAEEAK